MLFVIFESSVNPSKEKIADAFYNNLIIEIAKQPGLIETNPYTAKDDGNTILDLSTWHDEESIRGWRTHAGHSRAMKSGYGGVFTEYRLRVALDITDSIAEDGENTRSEKEEGGRPDPIVVIYKRPLEEDSDGKPVIAETSELVDGAADLLKDVVSTSSYVGEKKTVWLSSWPDRKAAARFGAAVRRVSDDELYYSEVTRDYTKIDRREAPKND